MSVLQNVTEKIKNGSITLFLFNILKLLCSNLGTFTLFSYIKVCIEFCGELHLRVTACKFTFDWM